MERNLNSIAASVQEFAATAAEGLASSLKVNRNLIAAALVIACGTDEGERCAPPSGIILLEWPYNSAETGNTSDTSLLSGETNETGETTPHTALDHSGHTSTLEHSGHSGSTHSHTGQPFIDSDGDRFSDAYEQSRGTDSNNAFSRPYLDIEVMGMNHLVGYLDRNQTTWFAGAPLPLPYTAEQSLRVHPNLAAYIEVESYGAESVVGIRFNTDEYRDDPQDAWLGDCGSQITPWDPSSQICQMTANVTRVQDPTTLNQWSVLSTSYAPDSFTQWYRVLDPSGAIQEYPAMELRLP